MNNYFNNKRLLLSIFWIIVGVILIIACAKDAENSNLWSGIGGGLMGVGLLQLFQQLRYRKDPEYKEKKDIEASDERNSFIRMKAWSWTGYIFTIGAAVLSVVFLTMGKAEVNQILALCVCAMLVTYFVSYYIINKKY